MFLSKDKLHKGPTYYDPSTKQIVNAKEGSLTWWHEKGHIEFENSLDGMNKDFSRLTMSKLTMFFVVLSLFIPILKFFALMFMIGYIYYFIYEEAFAWRYAFKMFTKDEDELIQKQFSSLPSSSS